MPPSNVRTAAEIGAGDKIRARNAGPGAKASEIRANAMLRESPKQVGFSAQKSRVLTCRRASKQARSQVKS